MIILEKDRVGETNKNKRGTLMEIIKYNSSEDMDVRFLDEFFFVKKGVTYDAFKKGGVKNPFDRNVYGIGYIALKCRSLYSFQVTLLRENQLARLF